MDIYFLYSFRFKRPDILKLWLNAIKMVNWQPSKTSKLCSAHFLETDYQHRPGSSVKLLKPDSVPSIFNFPQHLIKTKSSRRILKRHLDYSEYSAECGSSEEPPKVSYSL